MGQGVRKKHISHGLMKKVKILLFEEFGSLKKILSTLNSIQNTKCYLRYRQMDGAFFYDRVNNRISVVIFTWKIPASKIAMTLEVIHARMS